jgi:hypothetical protein
MEVTRTVPSGSISFASYLREAIASISERYLISLLMLSSGGDATFRNASSVTRIRTSFAFSDCIMIAQPKLNCDRMGSVSVAVSGIKRFSRAMVCKSRAQAGAERSIESDHVMLAYISPKTQFKLGAFRATIVAIGKL